VFAQYKKCLFHFYTPPACSGEIHCPILETYFSANVELPCVGADDELQQLKWGKEVAQSGQ